MIVDKTNENVKTEGKKLLDDKNTNSNQPVILKMSSDDCRRDSPTLSCPAHPSGRKESILGSFHKHLRSSFKAVSESSSQITRYRQTRYSSRRVRKRVIFKQGECNVVQGNVSKRRKRYMQDIFTTLVDAQWRWTLLVFALSFLISWAAFAVIWWAIAYMHGDIEYLKMEEQIKEAGGDISQMLNETFTMCVTEIHGFTSAFLFSVETQHTIGYGNRYLTEECPEAIFVMSFQSITGVVIQAFMVGIVFAKLSRPKKRAQTLLFSRNSVICHRDGVPCLMFRVGDMRKSHIIEAHVTAQIIRKKITKEGEELPFYQQELKVGADGGEDRLMFIWPTTIVHRIDKDSPLYNFSAQDMLKEIFEIVVMLEGVVESTGMTTQARSSYLPTEILWGHRFEHVVSFKKDSGEYEVDYTKFNNTYEIDTALCSSKQLDEVRSKVNSSSGLDRHCSAGLISRLSSAPVSNCHSESESMESVENLKNYSNSLPYSKSNKNSIQNANEYSNLNNNDIIDKLTLNSINEKSDNSIRNGSSGATTKQSSKREYNKSSSAPSKLTNDLQIQLAIDSIC